MFTCVHHLMSAIWCWVQVEYSWLIKGFSLKTAGGFIWREGVVRVIVNGKVKGCKNQSSDLKDLTVTAELFCNYPGVHYCETTPVFCLEMNEIEIVVLTPQRNFI